MKQINLVFIFVFSSACWSVIVAAAVSEHKLNKFKALATNQAHLPSSFDKETAATFIVKYNFDKPGCNAGRHGRTLAEGGPFKTVRDELVAPNFPTVLSKVFGETIETTKRTMQADILKPIRSSDRHSMSAKDESQAAFSFLPQLGMESIILGGDLGRKAMADNSAASDTTGMLLSELQSMPCVEQAAIQPQAQLFQKAEKKPEFFFDYGRDDDKNTHDEKISKYPQDDGFQHLWWYMSQKAAKQNYPDGDKFVLPRVQEVHNAIWTANESEYLVGVIDSGLDLIHPEFFNEYTRDRQYFFNEAEAGSKFEDFNWFDRCTDMQDNDGNGFTDDCFGLDILYQWYPWEGSSPFPIDWNSHGTHVSGTIAARTDNIKYVSSACPGCKIVPITPMYIFEALEYAARQNIKILNMSFGYRRDYVDPRLYDIFIDAFNKYHEATDGLIVVAAGNEPFDTDKCTLDRDSEPSYCHSRYLYFGFPCQLSVDLPYVICVGASDYYGKTTVFSTYGKRAVQVFAPGTDIYSSVPIFLLQNAGILRSYRGTSMATPIIAGIAALLRSKFPNLTAEQTRKALVASCKATDQLHDKCECGGVVNALKAFAHATVCSQTPGMCGQPLQLSNGENEHESLLSWFCKKASVFGHNLSFCDK